MTEKNVRKKTVKDGGVELLEEKHFKEKNPWGQPVVGWLPTSQGVGGLYNPRGYAMLRVVLNKLMDEGIFPLYDQPIIIENPGSVIIPQLGDRIGLVQNFRMVGERLFSDAGIDYIKRLEEEKRWEELLDSLGRWCWEVPRGLALQEIAKGETLKSFIIRTAQLEAMEEAGFLIEDTTIVGRVNANHTFFPHSQYVVHAKVVSIGEAHPENLEIIGGKHFFTMQELREMNRESKFEDGMALAGLSLCGLTLPM